jgi:hypothetical protein
MKVAVISAILSPAWSPEGDQAMHLCSPLAAKGCEIDVMTSKGYGSQKLLDHLRVQDRMQRLNWRALPWSIASWVGMGLILMKNEILSLRLIAG